MHHDPPTSTEISLRTTTTTTHPLPKMAATNEAAYLDGVGHPLRIGPAEMPTPAEDEIIIRNRAVAINPVSCASKSYPVCSKQTIAHF